MATEQFTNGAQTTLTAAMGAATGTQTISVFATTGFPGSGNFRIRIDSELLVVTAVSGTAWTVDRAQEGTTGAAHSSGAVVTQVLTAGALGTLGGGGTGTVTSVSVTTANGVSGTVASPTTTPAITLALGAITPTSVNGVALSGSSTPTLAVTGTTAVSGTNTGDQTSVTGNAGTATKLQTARAIYGNSFDGTADLTQVIASTFGGTGNGFTKFTGPAASEKTFTLPNASATVLTDNAAVTVAQGGTGQTSYTNGQLLVGNTTGNTLTKATLTAGTGISVTNGAGSITIAATGGTGTVTSVGLSLPAVFSVSGSPVTASGTLTAALATQSANLVWAGPSSGSAAAPTFRALASADLTPRGYIDGHTLTRASATTVTVAAGVARDGTDAVSVVLSSAVTKTLQSSGSWTAGTGNNGLDTGSRANSTWYHVYVIAKSDGTSDALFSTSATSPTLPTGYGFSRRVGSVLTDGSGNVTDFVQRPGGEFYWLAPVPDVFTSPPTTNAYLRTLSVPTGVRVKALVGVGFTGSTAGTDNPAGVLLTDPSLTDTAPSASLCTMIAYNVANNVLVPADCWTNTSAQIRSRCQLTTAGMTLVITTSGWVDPRGTNA